MARTVLQKTQENLMYALITNSDGIMKPFMDARDEYNEMLDVLKPKFFSLIVNLLRSIDGYEIRLTEKEANRKKPILDVENERDILVNRVALEWIDHNDILNSQIRISGRDEWCLGERKKDGKQKNYDIITKDSDSHLLLDLYYMILGHLSWMDYKVEQWKKGKGWGDDE